MRDYSNCRFGRHPVATGCSLVHWLDTPRAYVNEYSEPLNGAKPVRTVYLTAKASNVEFDRAAADYATRVGTVVRSL